MVKFFNMKLIFQNFLAILLAANCVGLAIALFVASNFGGDPLTVLQDGMHLVFHITLGQSSLLFNGLLLVVVLLCARQYLGYATVGYMCFLGFFIDFYTMIISKVSSIDSSLFTRLFSLGLGQLLLSLGFSILIVSKQGSTILDALILKIEDVSKYKYSTIRIAADAVFSIIGFCLGGILGIGTLFSVISTGFMIEVINKKLRKVQRVLVS